MTLRRSTHGRPQARLAGPARAPWRTLETRTAYDNPWIGVTEHRAIAPSGAPADAYGVVRFKNLAIGILPLHEDGTVTLVGQNRFPLGDHSWEIVEGGGPMDEPPLHAAQRELREETGLEAAEWRTILPRLQLSNSTTDERGIGFVATGLTPGETDPDETEDLAVARVPFREALEAAVAGWMPDALSVVVLLRAHHMAVSGELRPELARRMLEPQA